MGVLITVRPDYYARSGRERGSEIDERVGTGTAVECLPHNHQHHRHHHSGGAIMRATTVAAAGVRGDDYGQISLVFI